jgi:CheY-like chemotaxis protein
MGRLLASEGFEPISYAGPEDFFVDPSARSTDLIILDMDLPGMGEVEAIEKLRDDGFLVAVPLVMLSGTSDVACVAALRKYVGDEKILAVEFYGKDHFSFDMLFVRICNLIKMRDLYLALRPAG